MVSVTTSCAGKWNSRNNKVIACPMKVLNNVLYITYDGLTDPLGQSQVLPYLVGLAGEGYQITIISCEKKDRHEKLKTTIEKIITAAKLQWYPLSYTKKPPVLSTVLDVRKMKQKAEELHRMQPFDLVHCRSYVGSLVGLYMKEKFAVKYLFDMRGFWPDEKVDAGQWRLQNPLYRIVYTYFKKKEKQFIEQADHIISLTHRGVQVMQQWKHVRFSEEKLTVIPCCVDTELFRTTTIETHRKDTVARELNIEKGDLIISYLGGIGTWYMLDEMLDFFKIFKKHYPSSRFMFITHDEHKRIRQSATAKGLDSADIIIRSAGRTEVPVLLSLSTYSVFFIRPTYSKAASSPTKQGELMAMQIPVICNAGVGDTDAIIEKYGSGILVNKFSDQDYEKAITDLKSIRFDPAMVRKGAEDYFALRSGIERYNKVYKSILQAKQ